MKKLEEIKEEAEEGVGGKNLKRFENQNFPMIRRVSEYISKHDYMFRICIIGDANVGKTSLLTRYCDNAFKDIYNSTIGVDFRVVTLQYNNTIAKVHVWDTAGQERFKSISVNYFRSTHGFMFMYDITNRQSFQNLQTWIDMAFASNKNSVVNFLIGNKSDLEENRQVSTEEAKDLADLRNFSFFETSAKDNTNVSKAFEYFTYKLVEYYSKNTRDYENLSKGDNNGRLKMDEVSNSLDITKKKKKCAC